MTRSPVRVAVTGLLAMAVWVTLAAPVIDRSVKGAELGPWRDARLLIVAPLARLGGAADATAAPLDELPSPSPEPTAAVAGVTFAPAVATPSPRIVSADEPLRVLVIGDSMAGDLGRSLGRLTAPAGLVAVDLHYVPAAGLSRPDYFDWPARLAEDLARFKPEAVVVLLGANDAQAFESDGHVVRQGTEEWRDLYGRRVSALIAVASGNDRRVVWIGMPITADPYFAGLMRAQNDIYRARAASMARAFYLDTWALFADDRGRYAPYLPDENGRLESMRQADGIHLSVAGAQRLAKAVADELGHEFGFAP